MIVANALNNKFHDLMKNDILKKGTEFKIIRFPFLLLFVLYFGDLFVSLVTKIDLSVSYQSGPLKRIERCVAKAETDYSHAKYPTSVKILDIIRCACVYDKM